MPGGGVMVVNGIVIDDSKGGAGRSGSAKAVGIGMVNMRQQYDSNGGGGDLHGLGKIVRLLLRHVCAPDNNTGHYWW
jgi:hypothetical protein